MKLQISNCRFQISKPETRNRKLETRAGFTLLEVVVAMAIVGLGVVTLIEIFSLGLRLGARSSERATAVTYGGQVMDEVLIRRRVTEGGEEGSFGDKHRWRLQVRPLKSESKLVSSTAWELNEITLQVVYQDGGRDKQLEMRTLRLGKTGR